MKLKKRVFQLTTENQAKHCENWSGFLDDLRFQVGVNFSQREKTSVQVSAVPKSNNFELFVPCAKLTLN